MVPVFLAVPNFLAIEVKPRWNQTACDEETTAAGGDNATAGGINAAAVTSASMEEEEKGSTLYDVQNLFWILMF